MWPRLVTLAALLGSATLLTASSAQGDAIFDDPVGDQRNMADLVAPDITAVEVTNTSGGVITFRATIANHTTLPPRSRIAILFDLDGRQATGFGGFEYAVSHEIDDAGQPRVLLERWDEAALEFVVLPTPGMTSEFSNGVYTLRIPRGLLDNTIAFEFGMYAAALDIAAPSKSAVDDAPNTELWTYDLVGLPAPKLSTPRLVARPGRPVAGRSFVVQAAVRRSDTGEAVTVGTVACSARVAKASVRAVGGFKSGLARCVVSVPRNTKGKTLRGTMTVSAAGARLTRAFSYRVG